MAAAADPSPLEVDAVVLGTGPGGEAAAARIADAGLEVAVVEERLVGGECPYWGCMPSKALLRPAQALAEARRVAGAREAASGPLDVAAVLARRDEVVRGMDDASHVGRLERRGIRILRGWGRLVGERTVEVELAGDGSTQQLAARRAVVLGTGSRAALPPIEGLADAHPWTNEEATLASEAPGSLLVLGGGPIGAELAQAYATLGARVTLVEAAGRLLAREEPRASELVAAGLAEAGVEVRCGIGAARAGRTSGGQAWLELADGTRLEAEELLVAVGRRPISAGIGLEHVGVAPDERGFIRTDDATRVLDATGRALSWLYAVGDVTGRSAFTHTAAYHALVTARNVAGDPCECIEDIVAAPRVTFTEPQVAAVGYTAEAAAKAGIEVVVVDRDIARLAAASFHGRGAAAEARIVVSRESGCIIGASIVGPDAADLLHPATVAIVGEVPVERLVHAIAPFPTRSEVWPALVRAAHAQLAAG